MLAGSFNLVKSAVGVGVLALPRAMAMCGIGLGVAILAFGALTTASTLHFLARIAANTDQGDYFAVGRLVFGTAGEVGAVAVTLLYLFGGLIVYAAVAGKNIRESLPFLLGKVVAVKPDAWYFSMYVVVPVCAIFIFLLCCIRDLSKLSMASLAGLICMAYICLLTVFDYFADTYDTPPITKVKLSTDAINGFSTVIFAFCNHFTMLAIVPRFIDPTPKRRALLTGGSSTVVFIFYLFVAVFGYLHFGDGVPGFILSAGSRQQSPPYILAKLLVSVVIIFSYPLLCDPAKSCFDLLLTKVIGPASASTASVRNIGITAALVAFSAFIAATCSEIAGAILGIFSASCGSLLMFIFPALFFLKLGTKYRVSPVERGIAYFDILLGIFLLIFGTIFGVQEGYKTLMALRASRVSQ